MMAKMCGAGTTLPGGRHHMAQQRLAGNLVQHLGMPRFQPRSFSGCKNRNGKFKRFGSAELSSDSSGFIIT